MELLTADVVVFENNETRADLYSLWLDEYDVRVALTKGDAAETLDEPVAVAVMNGRFADGAAGKLLERLREEAPACRVIETVERSTAFPELGVDHTLERPVFEEELVEMVETLLARVNYQIALTRYYRVTLYLASAERKAEQADGEDEPYDRALAHAGRLRAFLRRLRGGMSDDDVASVVRSITFADITRDEETDSAVGSKYRPNRCTSCKVGWEGRTADGETNYKRLGAFVWQCTGCGHVQMHADPSHQHLGSYRR